MSWTSWLDLDSYQRQRIGGRGMHWRQMEVYRADGADGAGGEQSVKASEAVKAGRTCQSSWKSSNMMRWRNTSAVGKAVRASECIASRWSITGGGMCQRHRNASEEHRGGRNWQSWQSWRWMQSVGGSQSSQNWLRQDGTCLGLLLLHVEPNGNRFGGQAFIEHYSIHPLYLQFHLHPLFDQL
jgi:hypothetical protein